MAPQSTVLLSLIVVALGIIGVILSFLVPDRKKSILALGLSGIIIVVGLFQMGSNMTRESRFKKRMNDLRKDQRVDMEKLKENFQKQAEEARKKIENTQKK